MKIENLLQQLASHGAEFELYFNKLNEFNSHTNLTAIIEHDQVYIKHFLDSVLPIEEIPFGASVVDVGTGAGFPGLPIKIVRPDVDLTLVDSLNKRINFLVELTNNLASLRVENNKIEGDLKVENNLNKVENSLNKAEKKNSVNINKVADKKPAINKTNADVKIFHARAEDFCLKYRESFDVAVARAVAKLNTLLEYLLPLIKVGGIVLAYKGSNWQDELDEGCTAIKVLGGEFVKTLHFDLPNNMGERNIIVIKKVKPTPKQYPRGQNKPKTQPIN